MRPLQEQVIVITGASSGLGRATALRAARQGARLALAARGAEALATTMREVEAAGGRALVLPVDVADAEQVRNLGRQTVDEFGRIDTWVNNAGVALYGEFATLTPEEFARVIAVNLLGEVYGTMVALEVMRRQEEGGTIVNVASVDAERAIPLQSADSAAKAGVKAFSEALRVELEHERVPVRITVVKPASLDTPLFAHAMTKLGVAPKPLPPVYDPELAASAILHAATHPTRDLDVGGAAAALTLMEETAPGLLDWELKEVGWKTQRTDTPKAPTAPNNLFHGEAGPGAIHGGWDGSGFSPYTWLALHPNIGRAALGMGAAVAAGLGLALARLRH